MARFPSKLRIARIFSFMIKVLGCLEIFQHFLFFRFKHGNFSYSFIYRNWAQRRDKIYAGPLTCLIRCGIRNFLVTITLAGTGWQEPPEMTRTYHWRYFLNFTMKIMITTSYAIDTMHLGFHNRCFPSNKAYGAVIDFGFEMFLLGRSRKKENHSFAFHQLWWTMGRRAFSSHWQSQITRNYHSGKH